MIDAQVLGSVMLIDEFDPLYAPEILCFPFEERLTRYSHVVYAIVFWTMVLQPSWTMKGFRASLFERVANSELFGTRGLYQGF